MNLPESRSEPESQRAPVILPNNLWPAPGLWQCRSYLVPKKKTSSWAQTSIYKYRLGYDDSGCGLKFQPTCFCPRRLHISRDIPNISNQLKFQPIDEKLTFGRDCSRSAKSKQVWLCSHLIAMFRCSDVQVFTIRGKMRVVRCDLWQVTMTGDSPLS